MVNVCRESSLTIAVMGSTGTGKSTFINLVSGFGSPLPVGNGLNPCTKNIGTVQCVINDRSVTLIDTPGFDDTTYSETEIMRMIAQFLTQTYEKGLKLSGVIYMHRISDNRMGGLAQRNFEMFKGMCGIKAAQNVAIVTSMWDRVGTDEGEARENELKTQFFKSMLDQGAQLLRSVNTPRSARDIVARFFENQPVPLRIQQELVDEYKDLNETAAGVELLEKLAKQQEFCRNEINSLKENINDMLREKAEEIRQEQQKEIQLLNEKVARMQKAAENMAADFQKERTQFERQEELGHRSDPWNPSNWGKEITRMAQDAGVYVTEKFSTSVRLPPPGTAAQVAAAVTKMFSR